MHQDRVPPHSLITIQTCSGKSLTVFSLKQILATLEDRSSHATSVQKQGASTYIAIPHVFTLFGHHVTGILRWVASLSGRTGKSLT